MVLKSDQCLLVILHRIDSKTNCCILFKGSFAPRTSEREIKLFSLIFVTAQCEHNIRLSMNPSANGVAFALAPE